MLFRAADGGANLPCVIGPSLNNPGSDCWRHPGREHGVMDNDQSLVFLSDEELRVDKVLPLAVVVVYFYFYFFLNIFWCFVFFLVIEMFGFAFCHSAPSTTLQV